MDDQVNELVERSLALPPDDRAHLADLLLASLAAEPRSDIETAWDEEVERRLAAYDRGEVEAVDADLVFARAAAIAR